jgi:hypothetical protein
MVCGGSLPAAGQECPACHASARWQDLLGALQFVQGCFEKWEAEHLVGSQQLADLTLASMDRREALAASAREGNPFPADLGLMRPDRCWGCDAELHGQPDHCPGCGLPAQGDPVQKLRWWHFAWQAVKAEYDARRLPLAQTHACMNSAKGRVAALRAELEKDRTPVVAALADEPETFSLAEDPALRAAAVAQAIATQPAGSQAAEQPPPGAGPGPAAGWKAKLRRPLWEILLDPRSIQWLLGLGGALLVVGLVIWLATLGIFNNPAVVAVVLGLANTAVLGGGWAVTHYTRYQTAGRALTLLACLVMPLNLWFYHANGLITLEGHLWVAALVCCVLYAASALVLRDPMFVYVLAGGVAMTGLLMLADMGKFWEIAAPSTLLLVLGMISIHVERAFAEADGPFSRRRFGLAFFWSGHVLLAAGLLLLLGAQLAGDWLYKPFFQPFYEYWGFGPPAVVAERWGQLLALGLVLAGTYAYAYSDLVVRRVGVYLHLAVFTLLWAEVLVINLFALSLTAEVAIIALALTAMAANLGPAGAGRWQRSLAPGETADAVALGIRPLARAALPLGLLLSTLPVLLGIVLHLRANYQPLHVAWPLPGGVSEPYTIGWLYVGAMLLTAVTCRIGAHLYRHAVAWLAPCYFFGTAAATLLAAAGLLSVLGIHAWDDVAPLLMPIPIVYLVAARVYRGHTQERPLAWVAQAATGVILASVVAASAHLTPQHVFEPETGQRLNLMLALVFGEAAAFYALATAFRKHGANVYLCTAAASGAIWQLLQYAQVGPEYYTLTFAVAGLVLLVGYRLAFWEPSGLAEPAFQCANALMSLSFVAAGLLTLSRLATLPAAGPGALHWSLAGLLAGLVLLSLLAAWLVRHSGWRRWYLVMAISEGALMFLTIHLLSHLSVWDKLEIFSVALGTALLVGGHVGWYREQDEQRDVVTFSLALGSLLVGVPLAAAVLVHRSRPDFSMLNELGMLLAGMVLLATGFMFRLRSTTLAGATLLVIYLVTLVLYINMLKNVQTAAIWMTIGGGVIFTTGLLLSIYRDRLLALPDKVKHREGLFRVLGWR